MKIKYREEIIRVHDSSSVFCCNSLIEAVEEDRFIIKQDATMCFWGTKLIISYCPFCGEKIELEKAQK